MKSIYYWSPCLTRIGTYTSTINSAVSIARYSKGQYSVKIINICGEWDSDANYLNKNGVEVVNLGFNYFKYLPKTGFVKTRISYLIIIFLSIIPYLRLIIKKRPDFLIIHLLTSLPLLICNLMKSHTKIILRISGFPKINFLRKFIWKTSSKNIFKVTCPTKELKHQLTQNKIFNDYKLAFLPDPIIKVSNFKKKINFPLEKKRKYFISVGRLTNQKNFRYLINEFSKFLNISLDYDLYIFGSGEEKNNLKSQIIKKGLESKVFLMGFSTNINQYMKRAEAFVLSSLWEDPGFVLIEAAMNNLFIISSNCKNGPKEFLDNGKGGFLFDSNKKDALLNSLIRFQSLDKNLDMNNYKLIAKKNCKNYTLLRHFKIMDLELLRN